MLMLKNGLRIGKLLLGGLLAAGLAAPAMAGDVWSWRTEDGAYSFTDDPKRIPARYRSEAQKRSMGKLARYERFTEVSTELDKPYAERIRERRAAYRSVEAAAPQGALVGVMATGDAGMLYNIPVSGNRRGRGPSVSVPIGGTQSMADEAPTVIEDIRVKPRHSLATRHVTVVKKGDRVVSVIKAELNQRPLKVQDESDFER